MEKRGFLPIDLVKSEVTWFYTELGIDDGYFSTETTDDIANSIHSLYAAKIAAYARDDKRLEIRLNKEATDHALYIDTSVPGVTSLDGPRFEQRIDANYLDGSRNDNAYRVETFRSPSILPGSLQRQIRCYFVYQCDFVNPKPAAGETRLEVIGDKRFLQKATQNTKDIYQELIDVGARRRGPVIEIFDVQGSREKRLVIGYKQASATSFFSALSDLYHYYGLTTSRKYVEQFSNGVTIITLYLGEIENSTVEHPPIEESIEHIIKEVSLLYCVPRGKFERFFARGALSLQETIYAHCCWVFVSHFLNRLGGEYNALAKILDSENSAHAELLSKIKRRLRNETFTADYLVEIMRQYPRLIRTLYLSFANVFMPPETNGSTPALSRRRSLLDAEVDDAHLDEHITKVVASEHDEIVFKAIKVFNNSILKTNFFTTTKVGMAFRMRGDFLPVSEYPQPLYGMFLVVSSEFRGFHLRFKDVARGGIRIVKSRSKEAHAINTRSLFDENYQLAATQSKKNKDIPEGGSKGVILLDVQHQDKARIAFEKYIDAVLDLLLKPNSPGIKDPIVDLYGIPEILFLGPDENTAGFTGWAVEHARQRGAPWWKSFFTGKSPKLGGIPHDRYGMTSLSVREYVLGIYRELQLDPSKIRKLQTGGPDGDLGSNEILLANEKYCAIIDGSGVLVDPSGLDDAELRRLAKQRLMISQYDTGKLSPDGYKVLVEDSDVKLPSGEVISNGTTFRNTFHLRGSVSIDMFVPCGGRPESIDISSVGKLIVDKKTIIPYIVEGANLFLTQDAKLRLEDAGCIIFKDASANKGGVTSSSLEVLAALAFDDRGFVENMCMTADGALPSFYRAYVEQVQETVRRNARLEFEAIWREHAATRLARSIVSDRLSEAITTLDEELQNSELWNDVRLRRVVLEEALPQLLVAEIGLDVIIDRVSFSSFGVQLRVYHRVNGYDSH